MTLVFVSFWFWNIDGAVGRRVILIWNLIMYIGQAFKDIIRFKIIFVKYMIVIISLLYCCQCFYNFVFCI